MFTAVKPTPQSECVEMWPPHANRADVLLAVKVTRSEVELSEEYAPEE